MSDSDLLSAIWLRPIIGLVQNREFDEAYALAGYFPATPGRRLIQCVALLGQDKLAEGDTLLKTLPLEMHPVVANSQVLGEDGIDFLEVGHKAFRQKYFYAANFCLETGLSIHPEAAQVVIEGMLDSAAQVLAVGDLDLGKAYLKRVIQVDASPSRLIQWAEAALVNRQAESAQSLSEFARELIERALEQVPVEDTENRYKAAKLLAIDAQTFETACELLRQILQDCPSASVQVSDLLLPLVDYKPYFSDIADFLLEVDPGNVTPLTEKLVETYRRSRGLSYLKKAQSLLDALDYVGQGHGLQLARAVLTVGRESDNFELYARRLAGLEISPDISLEAAQILLNNKALDYTLVTQFLEQTLQCEPGRRAAVLHLYARLSKLAEGRGQPSHRERFFKRALNLSINLKEFLDLSVSVGDSRADQLLTLISDEHVLSQAPWYSQDETNDVAQALTMQAVPQSRIRVLYALLDQYTRISADRLSYWLELLFQTDLELTEHDVERIQSKIALSTLNWQIEVQKKLTKHLISKARKELEQLHFAELWSKQLYNVIQEVEHWLQRASQEPGWRREFELERLESVMRGLERLQCSMIEAEQLEQHARQELQQWLKQTELSIEQLERAVEGLEPEQLELARRDLESSSLRLVRQTRTSEEFLQLRRLGLGTEWLESIEQRLGHMRAKLARLEQMGAEPAQVRGVVSTLARVIPELEWGLGRATSDLQRVMVDLGLHALIVGAAHEAMAASDMPLKPREVLAAQDSVGKPNLAESERPTVKIERHTRIDFPAQCDLERKVELRIQLTKDVPKLTRVLKKVTVVVGGEVEQVTLDVHITAPGFAVQQWHKPLVLPVSGDSEEVVFTLVPLELGEQVVEIEFFHEASRVGYALVTTNVKPWWSRSEAASNVLLMEDPIDSLKHEPAVGTKLDRRILHVGWSDREEGRLCYSIYSPDPEDFGEWHQSVPNVKGQITDYLRELNAFLAEVATKGSPVEKQWDSICFNMQAVGKSLFETLIPSPVAERMQRWQSGSYVIVSTNEQWVPWELVYDGEDFWGRKFILARYPRLSDRRRVPDANRPQGKRRKRIRHIVNVVGGGVPRTEAHRAAQLFKTLVPSVPPELVRLLQEEPVSVLQEALAGVDALHFTCHGHLEPHMLQIAGNKSRTENLLPQTIRILALEPGSFVFANACASSAPVLTFGKFSNFGWEFYRQGADIFIGTLGAVPAKYAVSFAEAVYRELFQKDTQPTIGQAMAAAKETAAGEHNLFWLLYCIYGEPDLSIQVS